MQFESASLYRQLYVYLLHLYPRQHRERFGPEMGQTFNDLCRERTLAGKGLFSFMLWVFGDTVIGMISIRISYIFSFLVMHAKHVLRPLLITAAILAIPALGKFFSSDMQWGPEDFILMGLIIFGTAFAYELFAKMSSNVMYRSGAALGVITALMVVWVTLAVGIIGEDNPANLMYLGVLAVGLLGAIIARLKPMGMMYTLFAMAAVQFLAPVVALVIWPGDFAPGVVQVFFLNGGFVVMFIAAGLMFRNAALDKAVGAKK